MNTIEPHILCVFYSDNLKVSLECLQNYEKVFAIEFLRIDCGLEDKIKNSPFRFEVALLEVEDIKKAERIEIVNYIKKYYSDIEIVYIVSSGNNFFLNPEQSLPGYHADLPLKCNAVFQLLSFLCRQSQSRREQQMLEDIHQLTLEINEKNVDLNDILTRTCRTAIEIMKVDHSGFVLFEKDISHGKVVAEFPKILGDETVEIPINGIEREERLVFKREPINIQNLEQDKSLGKELRELFSRWNIRSILIVPVELNNKVIGSFSLDMINKCRHFYKDEIEYCRKLAAHVALAIGNTRHLKEISVLNAIGLAIEEKALPSNDLKQLVESIREKAAQLVDVKNFFLLSYDESKDHYEFLFHKDEKDDISNLSQEKLRCSFSAFVIRQKKPKILKSKDIDELIKLGEIQRVGNKSKVWLGAPLIARNRVIGVMSVQSYTHEEAYDEHDLTILSTIASQAAIAIDNYKLHQNINQQLLQINALYGISQAIMEETPNITALIEKIVCEAVEFSQAQAGLFIFFDNTKKVFRVIFSFNLEELKDMEFYPEEGMIGQVIKTGRGHFTNNYFEESFTSSKLIQFNLQEKIKGMVQVPLKWKNKIIGILAMTSRPGNSRNFNQSDVEQLEQFARPVTIAIGIARTISFQQTLFQSSPEAIIAVDQKGKITEFSRTSEQITGYNKKDVLGKFVANFYSGGIEETRRMKKKLDECDLNGQPVREIHAGVKGKNGERIPIIFAGAILKDEFGQKIGSIGLMRDSREITRITHEYQKQQSILEELEFLPINSSIKERRGLEAYLNLMLEKTCKSCRLEYMILFAGMAEKDTVLQPIAWWGLPVDLSSKLPIFNWRKAGFIPEINGIDKAVRQEARIIQEWLPDEEWQKKISRGIRGQNKEFFQNLACGVPVRLADNFRSLLVFGPFIEQTNLMSIEKFLKNIALTINIRAMSWLQAIYLQARRRESENALELITHRARMYLQQITGKFGMIKLLTESNSPAFLKSVEGENLAKHTAKIIKHVLSSQSSEMEREDFSFHNHSLSALVQNCILTFEERAREKGKSIMQDESIDNLPQAEVDDRFFSVALSNLIENAIKYSFEGTYIKIFSTYDTKKATITVQDIGEKLDDRARENLLEPGKRWGMSPRARQIPGSGFGLWDSSIIAVAHDGFVDFSSIPYKTSSGIPAHLVKVWITIPLKQEKRPISTREGDK